MLSVRTPKGSDQVSRFAQRIGLAVLVSISLIFVSAAHAQVSNSALRGMVSAPSVDGLQVSAVNVDTGFTRTVSVRADGSYLLPTLPPGQYRVDVIGPGGAQESGEVTLQVGQTAQFNIDMAASTTGAVEEVVVTGQRVVTQQGGEVGVNITTQQIESLPQINRNFLAFADLAPGVSFETGANGATRIQGGAQDSRTVNVFIDGVGQKDYVLRSGITGQDSSQGNPFPQSAIGEYRVITQNYKAEYDQVSSAAVTAVSRSGSNEFEIDSFWDYTDDGMRSETPREKETGEGKVETTDQQFGVSVGGPIIHDELHFFVAYEGKRIETPVEVTPGGGVMTSDLPSEYQGLIGVFNRDFEEDLLFAKLDWVPTDRDLFQFSVKIRDETGLRWDNGVNTASFTHDINNDDTRIVLRYERAHDQWINDLRLTFEDAAWNPQPERENASFLELANRERILNVGGHPNFQDKGQKGWGIQNDFTWLGFDDHTIKAGVKLRWIELSTIQQLPFNPQYSYNVEFDPTGAGQFNDQIPWRLAFGAPLEGIGDGSAESDNFQFGIYIQDDWLITDRFELSYGVRWDYEETPVYLDWTTPQDIVTAVTTWPNIQNTNYNLDNFIATGDSRDTFKDAIQPRIGFTYDLTEVYQLFGGAGRAYDRTQFDFIQQESAAQTFPTNTFLFDIGDPDRECPGCPAWDPIYLTQEGRDMLLAESPSGGSREIRMITNDLEVPYTDQFSLGVRGFWGAWDGEVGVTRQQYRDGFAWLLGNRREDGSFFAPGEIWGAPFGFTPPGFGSILLGTNGLESDSNSLYLKAAKPYNPESGWGFNATYTYTDAEESRKFGETFSLDYPSLDDYPVLTSAGVPEHRLVMVGSLDLPWGMQLSGKFSYKSEIFVYGIGMPGDDNTTIVPRVTKAADDFQQLDLALVKYFEIYNTRLRLRADVLNVLNEENFAQFIGNGQSPEFGDVNNFGIGGNLPRTFKVSVGLSY